MISVVINTFNEEKDLERAIASTRPLAEEILVCDMGSSDGTATLARKLGAKVITHPREEYVEKVRNFMIAKTSGNWVLVLDPDEELPPSLMKRLKAIVKNPPADYFRLPRKNVIFGKWIKNTQWWPDYQIRFFKKGFVSWDEVVHAVPMTQGKGADLPAKEENAILHRNYTSIGQYLEKLHRYTTGQAEALLKSGYVFIWSDLVVKPLNEFFGRFFAGRGYQDGLHGLVLSSLQAFSELVVYLKVWEKQGFKEKEISRKEFKTEFKKAIKNFKWWLRKEFSWFTFPKLP